MHRLAQPTWFDWSLPVARTWLNRFLCWQRNDPHCGSSVSTIVKFSTYVDTTLANHQGRADCSHTTDNN
ncbi:hypothetical protein K439DRAFT_706789 [Ramaria rubella]|nr:hypothetical protein K439DRAFT_706789 [Ramaria rubella]